ncbi:MAG: PAS domain S-box protein [Nitrospirae bacterium]|nr:PAS domain S-box protein [Nitrospirota bacterium]
MINIKCYFNLIRTKFCLNKRVLYIVLTYLTICMVTVWISFTVTKKNETQNLRKETIERLALFDRYITAKIGSYDVYARILAGNPLIAGLCNHPEPDKVEAMNKYLSDFNSSVGAYVTYIMNKDGLTIASSNYKSPGSFIGSNFGFREYFRKAINGQPNGYIAIGTVSKLPGYFAAYPIRNGEAITGVFVIKYNLDIFQAKHFEINGILLMADKNNVVFATNDDRYLFHTLGKLPEETMRQIKDSRQYLLETLPPLPIVKSVNEDNITIVTLRWKDHKENNTYKDVKYLMEEVHNDNGDWHIHILTGLSRVNKEIFEQSLYSVIGVAVIFLIGIVILRMELDIRRRREYEKTIQKINEGLERKVSERTQELETKMEQMFLLEKTLHESEYKYRQLVEMSQEGVWAIDKNGNTIFLNQASAEMLGYGVEEMLGVNFFEFMDDNAKAKAQDSVNNQINTGKRDRLETALLHKNGKLVYVFVSASPLMDEQGNFIGSFAVISDITTQKETEEKLRKSLAEQELLLRELHHRVKNNLQVIAGLVGLQISHIEDKGSKAALKDTQFRIQSIALVHEKLYNTETLSEISIKEYITSFARDLFIFFNVDKDKIGLRFDMEDINVGIDVAIPCGLIINELLTNILKYAFKGRDSGEITIMLNVLEADELELIVSDNGVGLPEGIEIGKTRSLGLKVVSILVKQIKGVMEIDRANGTKFSLRFKK